MTKSATELQILLRDAEKRAAAATKLAAENEQWARKNETLLALAVKREFAAATQVKQLTKEIIELQTRAQTAEQRANEFEVKLAEANTALATLKQHLPDHCQRVPRGEEETKALSGHRQESSPPVEICLCTHNPRREVLDLILRSIAAQNVPAGRFLFLLVDNASSPAVPETVLAPLRHRGISCRLVQESRPGIFHARNRAMRESRQPLILWIDDDTEFPPDHVSKCLTIAQQHPEIGCFGGKLHLGPHCRFPAWTASLHPWLAIIDRGEEPITNKTDQWGFWEPPTAGAVVRREVIAHYLEFVDKLPPAFSVGQVGSKNLMRGEDSLLMRMAHRVDLACSYQPTLWGIHHLDNRRFRLRFLLRLLYGYGRSYVRLERIFGNELPPLTARNAWVYFWTRQPHQQHPNWRVILLMKAWSLGYIVERTVRLNEASVRQPHHPAL